MNSKVFHSLSIKTKVSLFTLVTLLMGIWSVSFYASQTLLADMKRILGEQQFSVVSVIASDLNQELVGRLRALESVAAIISPAMLDNSAALQSRLEGLPLLLALFNSGVTVTRLDGVATVAVPVSSGRIGVNYMDRDYIIAVLREGKTTVGKPVIGKAAKAPAFAMAAPIRDNQGKVIGALAGITDLSRENILDKITQNRYGASGGFFVVARQYRLIVTASDKSRIMETLPAAGISPESDRAIAGDVSSAVYVNPRGIEVLGAAKGVPASNWYVGAILPTEEAFAPIRTMQVRMLVATIIFTILACGLVWWFTRRVLEQQFSPMLAATRTLDTFSPTDHSIKVLPLTSRDEVGELIEGFNRVLAALGLRDTALRNERGRIRAILDTVGTPIFVKDNEHRIILANQAFCEMFAMDGDAVLGKTLVEEVPPEERQHFLAVDRRVLDTGLPDEREETLTVKGFAKTIITKKTCLVDESGERFLIGAIQDITERKKSELEIKRLNIGLEERIQLRTTELEEANRLLTDAKLRADAANLAKSAFLANMSHEIRTPMNGILGMANILRREGVTPQQAKRLDAIDTSAQHLLSVINDILDLSKIEAGKLVLEEAPVVVNDLLNNVNTILAERAKAKNIALLIETESLPTNLYGDPTRLQQALLNYTTNAIKFTEKGTVTLRTLKQDEADDSVLMRFEVQDTGIGIEPETLTRLFSAFEQADSSMTRKYGGTGLGLIITRHLAELMGGKAGAESKPGLGSTFWFTVKLKKKKERRETDRMEQIASVDAEALIQKHYSGHRILVVDDEPMNREVARIQLEGADLVVDTAEDGAEAIAIVRRTTYAAIFMDMQMPNLNGLEATQQIREIPGYRHTPIIAMTANAFAEDKARCHEAGMNDFLIKPFVPEEMFAILLRSLSQREV